jgi:hypothetical protein
MEKLKLGLNAKKYGKQPPVPVRMGDQVFNSVLSNNEYPEAMEYRDDEKKKLFILKWQATALAAGITQLSNSNSVTIANNSDFFPKKISAYLVRKAQAGTIQQAGSIQLQISSAKGFTSPLIISAIGAQWTTPAGVLSNPVTINCTPDSPQIDVDGFQFLGGADLVLNLTAFSFGTTILNDVIEAQIHIEY